MMRSLIVSGLSYLGFSSLLVMTAVGVAVLYTAGQCWSGRGRSPGVVPRRRSGGDSHYTGGTAASGGAGGLTGFVTVQSKVGRAGKLF